MKLTLSLAAACIALASLTACGGGDDPAPTPVVVYSPATLTTTDISIGTGAEAVLGKTVKVNYTGWLYNTTVANLKGTQFDTSIGAGKSPLPFTIGAGQVIPGFDQGVRGMKVGGKRTILIPAALGYGASGAGGGAIPPNSGLVFDVELIEVQ
jgi:FKBP-type peptidyl-prolyl cis-trans isomerase FkpA